MIIWTSIVLIFAALLFKGGEITDHHFFVSVVVIAVANLLFDD